MKQELLNILEQYGYPVRLQGSLGPRQKYPESFFTIWNGSTDDASHYDNDAIATIWDFDVNFYSTSPVLVNAVILDVRNKLKAAGWIVNGKGYDVASDEPTHTGRGLQALYRENNRKQEDK